MKEGFSPKAVPLSPEAIAKLKPTELNPFMALDISRQTALGFLKGCDHLDIQLSDEDKLECEKLHKEYRKTIDSAKCKCKHKGINNSYVNKFQKLIDPKNE